MVEEIEWRHYRSADSSFEEVIIADTQNLLISRVSATPGLGRASSLNP